MLAFSRCFNIASENKTKISDQQSTISIVISWQPCTLTESKHHGDGGTSARLSVKGDACEVLLCFWTGNATAPPSHIAPPTTIKTDSNHPFENGSDDIDIGKMLKCDTTRVKRLESSWMLWVKQLTYWKDSA